MLASESDRGYVECRPKPRGAPAVTAKAPLENPFHRLSRLFRFLVVLEQ
jgi:hypothetical protein